jgi:hypothetical protein
MWYLKRLTPSILPGSKREILGHLSLISSIALGMSDRLWIHGDNTQALWMEGLELVESL